MLWHSTNPKIQDWVDFKALEFAQEESKGSRLNPIEWLGRYLYTNIHDVFFSEFLIVLHEWLSRLETQQRNFQGGAPDFIIEALEDVDEMEYFTRTIIKKTRRH